MKKILINNQQKIELAEKLDRLDNLSNFKNKFHLPDYNTDKSFIYFTGNSLGLQPLKAKKVVNEELESWKKLAVNGHLEGDRPWLTYHELFPPYFVDLVGASIKEIVVMNSLTVNLHLLMVSFYKPMGNRKKILIEKFAFPSDKYAVQSQLMFHGNDPINDLIIMEPDDNGFFSNEITNKYFEKYGHEIALALIGGVNYYTGQVFEISRITKKAQFHGCKIGFDLAHAVGNIKLKLHDWGVDFASWCGYKYLNGGPGAPSGVFIHEKHLNKGDYPRFDGWWGHEKSTRFKMPDNFNPIHTAEAWQISNPPILSMAALLASLEIFKEAGIDNLIDKSKKLTSFLESLIKLELNDQVKIITPTLPQYRGCQLSFKLLNPNHDIVTILKNKGIICDWREPDVIRIAPVPLYNSFVDCFNFVKILKSILNEQK